MFGKKKPEELSIEELERLLLLKRREARQRRLREKPMPSHAPPKPGVQRYDELAFLERRRGSVMTRGLYRGARWYERLLVVVEVVALIGLLTAIFFYVQDWRANRELVRPPDEITVGDLSLAPGNGGAPSAVAEQVLPGRPPPPPNAQIAAIPVLYAEWLEEKPSVAGAPVVDEAEAQKLPARIVIPSIGVDAPIVEGDDWEALKRGVGHHLGSANPGERGNMVLSAHNDIFGEIFRYLEKVEVGDEVLVYDGAGREYRYIVAQKRIVEPTAVEVLAPSQEPIATLITCHPYLIDTQRLVVIAELDTSR
ncbi:MAG: class D sortase [Ardenticatenia bacterium]|nr:MAG: class D sortase [Ardenticatenia bacterium]